LDSAADNAATARDPHNQAIYGISRPANIFDMDSSLIERIKGTFNDVLDICGVKPGDKCDPADCRVKLILLLTDGDIDGDDIAISTVCFLAKHCKPLIDAGMVGRILPPAYSIPIGNGKRIYVRSQREFFGEIVKSFIKRNSVGFRGKTMAKQELRQFIQKNFEYDVRLNWLADRQCCDPLLMEYIAWSYHGHAKDQKKSYWMEKFKGKYKGLNVLMENGQLIIDGDPSGMDHVNLGFDDYFDKHLHKFKKYQSINSDIYGFSVNGEKDKTLYEVMSLVRSYIPEGVKRYKGLGELSTTEMKELCMDVDKRTVVIFKFEDFEKDMDKINVIMSTKKQYVEARKRLLMNMVSDPLDIDT